MSERRPRFFFAFFLHEVERWTSLIAVIIKFGVLWESSPRGVLKSVIETATQALHE